MNPGPPVTLANGQIVPNDSLEWRDECLARHRHVENIRRLPMRHQRQEYIENVLRKEGSEAAGRLRAAVTADWDSRRIKT